MQKAFAASPIWGWNQFLLPLNLVALSLAKTIRMGRWGRSSADQVPAQLRAASRLSLPFSRVLALRRPGGETAPSVLLGPSPQTARGRGCSALPEDESQWGRELLSAGHTRKHLEPSGPGDSPAGGRRMSKPTRKAEEPPSQVQNQEK